MHPLFKSVFVLSMLAPCFATTANASPDDRYDCSDRASAIVKQAYPFARAFDGGFKVGESRIALPESGEAKSVSCRVWPSRPQLTLAAVPLIRSEDDEDSDGDIELLVLDSANLALEGRLLLKNRAIEDAVRIKTIGFDTANYRLAPDLQAFGLRIKRSNSSRLMPYEEEALSLFTFTDGEITSVLDGLLSQQNNMDSDFADCEDQRTELATELSMARTAHYGYRDIDVLVRESSARQIGTVGDCSEDDSHSLEHQQLIFDGTHYEIPKTMKAGR